MLQSEFYWWHRLRTKPWRMFTFGYQTIGWFKVKLGVCCVFGSWFKKSIMPMLLKLAIQKAVGQPRDQPAHAPAARTAITWTWCFLLPNLLWIHHIPTWKDTGRIGGERAQHGQGHPKKTEKMLRPVNVFSINKFIYFLFEGPLQRQHLHLQGFQWIALRSRELNSDQMLTNYENLVVISPLQLPAWNMADQGTRDLA